MDDKATVLRFPAAIRDFSLLRRIQTGSGAYPVSCSMGKGDGHEAGHLLPPIAEGVND